MSQVVTLQKAQIYQKGTKVLADVDFEIEESQFVYLIGRKSNCSTINVCQNFELNSSIQ